MDTTLESLMIPEESDTYYGTKTIGLVSAQGYFMLKGSFPMVALVLLEAQTHELWWSSHVNQGVV